MNILYYDCFSGISGDMNLAAMIDLGVDPALLARELSGLGLDHEFTLEAGKDSRKGIHGTRVDVVLKKHHHAPHGHHHAAHRNLRDIETIIDQSGLAEPVKTTALAIFRRVAEAEARVHGRDLYEVHFHEVGAVDSIVDIVGAAVCFHALDIDQVWCSPVELGGGFVTCAHGRMPVPAPATVEILRDCPTTRGAVMQETTTPTGAAILAALTDRFTAGPALTMRKTAYGIGHRDTDIPNVLRVHLATTEESAGPLKTVPARLLQCNIDDMTGEMLGAALDMLMEEGAMDVHFTPVVMKKNRPATTISLLCSAEEE
ncbi:MAG TPA: nickel pincer cofactor biosynthesis protein LarC, partial [Desulfomicrobiaceae bacterium]|nr:nickel pincer cofactor biosynthesis protein LarC [Desulfomicrobiaceae bacterium]